MTDTDTSAQTREPVELPPGYYVEPGTGAWLTLPWPDDAAKLPPSLGPSVITWAHRWLVHHLDGGPWRYTRGQMRFLHLWYAIGPDGRWLYRSGVRRGAKGTGKDPLGATIALAELAGPVRFDGWTATGQPRGLAHRLALVQIAANSEAQAKDLLRVANGMAGNAFREQYGYDAGETRSQLADGGRIELLTNSEKSSEGDPATAVLLNEALALDTPVPTPVGWSTMGALSVGDVVFGADGRPARVVKATETFASRMCYRVTFADGTDVVADAGHLWFAKRSKSRDRGRVVTTEQLAGGRYRVPVAAPVELPGVDLPLDPYVLGAWLGDGSRGALALTTSADDMPWWLTEFARLGVPARHRRSTATGEEITLAGEPHSWANRGTGVRSILVGLGVYSRKRIPAEYLRGSVAQRLALLQGLVDTDGCVDTYGRVIFVNTNEDLARGVAELARSLGHVVQVSVRRDARKATYLPVWRVEWAGDAALPSARMPRKAARLRARSVSSRWLSVRSVEQVKSVPVRCIGVDSVDHLFLAGAWTVTHNSHHMTDSSGGKALAAVARRNVAKSPGGRARLLELTNAHVPGEQSVAEGSFEQWQHEVSGRARIGRPMLYDSREAAADLDIHDDRDRAAGIAAAYGDSPWTDLENIDEEATDTRTPTQDSIRFYFNALPTNESAWCEPRAWDARARPGTVVADRERVAMFLDCSKSIDATALTLCRLDDGHVLAGGLWQRPRGARGTGWLAPRPEVDAAVLEFGERFDVAWFGVDPSPARDDETEALYWQTLIDRWHRHFRDRVALWATPGAADKGGSAVLFDMRSWQPGGKARLQLFVDAAQATVLAVEGDEENEPDLTHDGDPAMRLHVHNARALSTSFGTSLGKRTRDSGQLVDYAVSMVGARMGRRLVLNSGRLKAAAEDNVAVFL